MFEDGFQYLSQLWQENEFFQGGAIAALITTILVYLRQIPQRIWGIFIYNISISVDIVDDSRSFKWVSKELSVLFKKRSNGLFYYLDQYDFSDPEIYPGGVRYYWEGLCLVRVALTKRDLEGNSDKSVEYSIGLTYYGLNKKKKLFDLIERSEREHKAEARKELHIRDLTKGDACASPLKFRDLNTVFSENISVIEKDLEEFYSSEDFYKKRGIPYRRGYLLYGPPGTGKTSSLLALANKFKKDLLLSNASDTRLLGNIFSWNGGDCFVVIEDIDSSMANINRDSNKSEEKKFKSSLSELLNTIDGAATPENVVYFFTANEPEKLDPALVRPGRIDVQLEFGYMNQKEFEMACQTYFGKTTTNKIKDKTTAATVQQVYLCHKNDFDKFVEELTDV